MTSSITLRRCRNIAVFAALWVSAVCFGQILQIQPIQQIQGPVEAKVPNLVQKLDLGTVSYYYRDENKPRPFQALKLPDAWEQRLRGGDYDYAVTADALSGFALYRLPVVMPSASFADRHWAVYIPRIGNRFEVVFNGSRLGSTGDQDSLAEDYVNQPQIFFIPPNIVRDQDNELEIHLRADIGRNAGLSSVYIGAQSDIRALHDTRQFWHLGGTLIIVALSLAIGVISLGYGLAAGGRQHIIFGAAGLLWAIRNVHVLYTRPPLPHPWWGWFIDMSYGLAGLCLFASAMYALRMWRPWMRYFFIASVAVFLLLVSAYALTGVFMWRRYWLLLLFIEMGIFGGLVIYRFVRTRTVESTVLLFAAIAGIAFGGYDHFQLRYSADGYGRFELARFGMLFMLLAMSAVLLRRANKAITASQRLRSRFSDRLMRAQSSLEKLHVEQQEARAQQATIEERLRIVRDMHDGVGSQLIGLLGMVRAPQIAPQTLELQVQQIILELRASIDGLQNYSSDWIGALAQLRERVEPRLHAVGVALQWKYSGDIAHTTLPSAHPDHIKHFQMLLLEIFTNIIKHAKASTVQVQVHIQTEQLQISVSDDGCGFDPAVLADRAPETGTGNGLRNMQHRASSLGAQLAITSTLGLGSVFTLTLDLGRGSA